MFFILFLYTFWSFKKANFNLGLWLIGKTEWSIAGLSFKISWELILQQATNNVNITVNLNQERVVSENKDESTSANEERQAENQRTKELAARVKEQVIRTITEQQRPGGLLGSNVYKKR